MKLTTSLLAAAAAVLGLGGAATAYQMASAPAESVRPVSQTSAEDDEKVEVVLPKIEQGVQFRWAPCKPPAVQQGDACVVEQVQTVVVPAPSSSGSGADSDQGGGSPAGDDDADDDAAPPSSPPSSDHDEDEDEDDHEDEDEPDHEDEPENDD